MSNLTSNIENLKSILITGGAGFIGSNFIPYFLEKYPNYRIICLDNLTYAGSLENLREIIDETVDLTSNIKHLTSQNGRFHFVKGDICNRELVEYIFDEYDIRGVIHFAAESHVDNSIKNPGVFIRTNVDGTYTLIDVAYKYWMEGPFKYRERYLKMLDDKCEMLNSNNKLTSNIEHLTLNSLPRFHHISTDEVYGTLPDDPNVLFTEETPYAPNSPYSASKASSDMIVRSYHHTFGMNTVITNCSNNYGPKQHDEKLIPTIIRNALQGNPIPIYGDGKNIRDWLYVLDHCKGIDLAYHKGRAGETYNIGGRNERTNIYIANKICEILDELYPINQNKNLTSNIKHLTSYKSLITFVSDRPGHDRRYAIDASKIENELGWKADENFESGIVKTVKWYLNRYNHN
jgi:dTDP-glucose 4,6-dehydratase